jgi:hypothetical protein
LLNSSFLLILHVPFLSFVGPNILLYIFLSIIINFRFTESLSTHVTLAYVFLMITRTYLHLFNVYVAEITVINVMHRKTACWQIQRNYN